MLDGQCLPDSKLRQHGAKSAKSAKMLSSEPSVFGDGLSLAVPIAEKGDCLSLVKLRSHVFCLSGWRLNSSLVEFGRVWSSLVEPELHLGRQGVGVGMLPQGRGRWRLQCQ